MYLTGKMHIGRDLMEINREKNFYERYIKRFLDIVCSLLAIVVFSWLYAVIAVLVRIKMGSPVLFKQPRPGMINPRTNQERIFDMYKFRTMTDERNDRGELLPDEKGFHHLEECCVPLRLMSFLRCLIF